MKRFGLPLVRLLAVAGLGLALLGGPAGAEDLYSPGAWPAMTSDRTARAVGDSLTVVIFESSSAANSIQGGTERSGSLSGAVSGGELQERGDLQLRGESERRSQSGRSGKLVAQISVTVQEVLPNGDFRVAGEQTININGKRTLIKVRGQVRPADIGSGNVVLSSRLANAEIDYDGRRFSGRKAAAIVARSISRLWRWNW